MTDPLTDPAPEPPIPPPAPGRVWPWMVALFAAIVLIAGGVVALLIGTGAPDPDHTKMAGQSVTVSLTDLTPATAELYQYARAHRSDFAQIPCYCGCDRMLAHRSLADCFVTPTGDWDAHGSGCGICTAEAIQSRTELDAGTQVLTVRAHIVEQFGTSKPMTTWSTT